MDDVREKRRGCTGSTIMNTNDDPEIVCARVGGHMQLIPFVVLRQAFEDLADQYRDEGLVGIDLDHAIADALPIYFDALVNGTGQTKH
jgi:hypothetical protein